MKIRIWSIVVFCLVPFFAGANDFKPYEWEKDRVRYSLSAVEQALSELVLKQHNQYEYALENSQFIMYSTIHRIVFVNNNEAVQKHNRIIISMNKTLELMELKARVINKDGRVIYFDKSNLKEQKDEESGNAVRIFAMEGVELGSENEYYFTRKMQGSIFDRTFMQSDVPIKSSSFLLSCPDHLKFDFKSYEGFPAVKQEGSKEINVYSATMTDVPALKKEPFSFFDPNRKRIEFKLAYNTGRSQARLYTWEDAAKTFYGILVSLSKDDDKALDRFLKTLNDDPSKKVEERIKNVEDRIKTAVQVNTKSSEESLSHLESVLKLKLASREGITKLFLAVYTRVKINCYPVITCNREDIKFDGAFDSWSFLDDYVIYFPETKGFLAPYSFESRYPLIPSEFTAQQGLFMEPFSVGEVKSALASIQEIPAADYTLSVDNLGIDVTFNEDLTSNQIRQKRDFGGYNAAFFTPYYDLMTQEQKQNMVEEITKQTAPDASIKTWTAKPIPGGLAGNFLVDVDFQSTHFLEKAGPRILFKVGELIGPQTEMYRDDERTTPVENNFNRGYDRTIKIHLPAGYQVKNLQDLRIDVAYRDQDKTPYLFHSEYTQKNDVLEISIHEYYKEIYAPVAHYEDFRKVVNAAADFNKITLVLEKK